MGFGPDIKSEILSMLADAELSTEITARWTSTTGSTTDPITGSSIGGTTVQSIHKFRAFTYEVSGSLVTRTFADIQMGDMMIDISQDDYDIFASQKDVVFTIHGKEWVQKVVGDALNGIWNASINGVSALITILLTQRK